MKFIKKFLSLNIRLKLYVDNILYALENIENIFNYIDLLPLLDENNFFYIYSLEWKNKLYSNIDDKEKLITVFKNYKSYICYKFLPYGEREFLIKLYDKEKIKYFYIYKNYNYSKEINDLSKELSLTNFYTDKEKKYGYYRSEIILSNGKIVNVKKLLIENKNIKIKDFLKENYKIEIKILQEYYNI